MAIEREREERSRQPNRLCMCVPTLAGSASCTHSLPGQHNSRGGLFAFLCSVR